VRADAHHYAFIRESEAPGSYRDGGDAVRPRAASKVASNCKAVCASCANRRAEWAGAYSRRIHAGLRAGART
jgi:hypothetical protein